MRVIIENNKTKIINIYSLNSIVYFTPDRLFDFILYSKQNLV